MPIITTSGVGALCLKSIRATVKKTTMNKLYGYIRVSSTDQNEDRQRIAMAERGIREENIFMDKLSGKDFDRPQYHALMEVLCPGDQLCVTSIDRLGRNYEEIQEQWRILTREKKVDLLVFDMPLLDTRRDRDLIGTLIADIVLQVLSFVAQKERENIRQRQAEGIAAARARGVKFGRAPAQLPDNFEEFVRLWKEKKMSESEAARSCGMARSTFRYRAKKVEKPFTPQKNEISHSSDDSITSPMENFPMRI